MHALYSLPQICLYILILVLLAKPVGIYLSQILNPESSTFLDPLIRPLEKGTYRLLCIDPLQEQSWKEYLLSIAVFTVGSLLLTFLILFFQPFLPLNPNHAPSMSWHLAINTAVSFVTNTNWQSYSGEKDLSYFSQMVALTVQNFISPAVGISVAAVLVRSIARSQKETVGHFWVDLIRVSYYLFIPLSLILAFIFIGEGIPQTISKAVSVETLEQSNQIIAVGPVASQESIKLLGTNGGGFFKVNSAHPFENPTPLCNVLQLIAIMLIPVSQIYYFGKEIGYKKHAWSIFVTLIFLLLVSAWFCIEFESTNSPIQKELGITGGNMEGKEQRFGTSFSALYTSVTTDASCGAVCSNFSSLTSLGGLIPMVNMLFSEAIFGGCGSGLYIMLIYVIVTIFFAGLIIGRTPEYLGKKIEAYDIKLTIIVLLSFGLTILGLSALAVVSEWGVKGLENIGPHGFSEIFYSFISSTANNGSEFPGLNTNSAYYNIVLSLAMLVGRFSVIIPVMALAGSLVSKKRASFSLNDLIVDGPVFTIFFMTILLLFGALTFLPALVVGPILEHLYMIHGTQF